MKIRVIIFSLLCLVALGIDKLHAQTDTLTKYKMIGMNMTPLISQVIPFKTPSTRVGPYNFIYKSYYKQNTAFRMGLGMNLMDVVNGRTFIHVNTRIGVEKQKKLYKNWYVNGGLDAIGFAGGFNIPGDVANTGGINFGSNPDVGLGLGMTMGVEYFFNPRISLSTESMLFLGLRSTTALGFDIVPPIGLFLNVKLN